MNSLISRGLVVAIAASLACGAMASEVRTNAFTIELPGDFAAFQKKADTQSSDDGKIDTTTWVSKSPSTAAAVIVAVSTMPGKIANTQKLFDKTRDALVSSLHATLESDESLQQSVPSRSLLLHTETAFIRARLMATNKRLYQILYVARSREQRTDPNVETVFGSLHLADDIAGNSPPK